MTETRLRLIAVGAVILACSVCYFIGRTNGRTDEKLAVNHAQIVQSDKHTDSVQIRTDSSKAVTTRLDIQRGVDRTRIRVVHDTIYAPSDSTDEAIYSPAIAQLIASDDSLISAQKHELALRDTLEASLRVGLKLRDQRIKLLESRGTQRFSKGFQGGVGVCQTATKREPCVYVGYGFSVRLP